jgi:ribosomal protein S18 acetylase RimI-like enzyme
MSEEPVSVSPEYNQLQIDIEQAVPDDAEAIYEVKRQGWLSAYPNEEAGITYEDVRKHVDGEHGEGIQKGVERWRSGLEKDADGKQRITYVAKHDGGLVGFVSPGLIEGQRRIGALYVLPEAQGQGVGSRLLQKAIDWHGRDEDIFLHVASYNENAINLYKRFGFELTGLDTTDYERFDNNKAIPEQEMVLKAL